MGYTNLVLEELFTHFKGTKDVDSPDNLIVAFYEFRKNFNMRVPAGITQVMARKI